MKPVRGILSSACFFLVLAVPGLSLASNPRCLNQTCFETARSAGSVSLPLRGIALLEFMKVNMYTGALYLPENVKTIDEALADIPKILVLHYHRDIKVSWMNRAADRILKKNPGVRFNDIRERVEKINASYQKVGKNDRYSLVYEPGKGTSLYLNNQFIIQIPGEDFQKAYFGIWLSKYPARETFRDQLLGKKPEAPK